MAKTKVEDLTRRRFGRLIDADAANWLKQEVADD